MLYWKLNKDIRLLVFLPNVSALFNTCAGEHDIKDVMREVGSVVPRYPQLGRELGVPPHELQRLQMQYGVNPDLAFNDMILLWLRGCSTHTWQALVRAVANPAGGNDFALARKIAARHEAGKH